MTWEYTCVWKSDPGIGSEVDVRFIAEGESVNGGWPLMLDLFKAESEQ